MGRFRSAKKAPDLGQFFDGAFAPLAFLWFVVGFFLQQRLLESNTTVLSEQLEVMRQTMVQSEQQSRVIAADELHSRQDTFLRITEMVSEQLGVTAGWIYTSWAAGARDASNDSIVFDSALNLWRSQGGGDQGAFDRECVAMIFTGRITAAELFWGTPIRSAHSEAFKRSFDRLVTLARNCDPEGIISDAIKRWHTWSAVSIHQRIQIRRRGSCTARECGRRWVVC